MTRPAPTSAMMHLLCGCGLALPSRVIVRCTTHRRCPPCSSFPIPAALRTRGEGRPSRKRVRGPLHAPVPPLAESNQDDKISHPINLISYLIYRMKQAGTQLVAPLHGWRWL